MGATITYPDGTQLTSDAFTLAGIQGALQPIFCGMLGVTNPVNTSLVRIAYPTQGAPFSDIPDDVLYFSCKLKDSEYDKIRDRANIPPSGYGLKGYGIIPYGGTEELDAENELLEQWNYTRVWSVHLTFYGPNSLDRERAVRSAMYQDYFTQLLSLEQLFPVSEFQSGVRTPELVDGQWMERVDFEFDMYEFVTETITRNTIQSVEVLLQFVDWTGYGEGPYGDDPYGYGEFETETVDFTVTA